MNIEKIENEDIEKWRKNFYPGNYFGFTSDYYQTQYVERDAWMVGLLCARKIYFMNKEVINEDDPDWIKYCNSYRLQIQMYISENKKNLENLKKFEQEIEDIYTSRIQDKEQIDLGKKIVDKAIKEMNFKNLSYELTLTLLSPYCFIHLDTTHKEQLLKRMVLWNG